MLYIHTDGQHRLRTEAFALYSSSILPLCAKTILFYFLRPPAVCDESISSPECWKGKGKDLCHSCGDSLSEQGCLISNPSCNMMEDDAKPFFFFILLVYSNLLTFPSFEKTICYPQLFNGYYEFIVLQ